MLTDPEILNLCIKKINNSSNDLIFTKGLPVGLNCKVFSSKALNYVNSIVGSKNNADGFMEYFYRSKKIKKIRINFKSAINKSRFTIDYSSDVEFVKYVYIYCKLLKLKLNFKNYINLLKKFPYIKKINNKNDNLWNKNNKNMKKLTIIEDNKIKRFKVA